MSTITSNDQLQASLRMKPILKLEMLAAVSKVFRDHQEELSEAALHNLRLSVGNQGPDPDDPPPPAPSRTPAGGS